MDYTLTEPQTDFFNSEAKATCAVAGFGSGKTDVAMVRLVSSAISIPGADWLYSAPTIPLIRDILWAKLESFLPGIGIKFHINKAESIVYMRGLGRIFCRSLDNPDRLVGFEVVDAFIDELDILPKDKALNAFRKIKARCRQKVKMPHNGYKKNQQWVTTTPEGFKATYELFKKNPAESSRLIQMSTYSNAHNLPEDYIQDLLDSYPPQLIQAYLNGEFVNLASLGVWRAFGVEKNHKKVEPVEGEDLYIGMDFNVGRGCAVVYVIRFVEGYQCLCAVDEVYNSYDTPDTIKVLKEKFNFDDFPNQYVIPDASGGSRKSVNASISDLSLLKRAGYKVRQRNKNPSIKDRVVSANAAFCNSDGVRKVYVDTKKCPSYTEALTQQAYDKNGLPAKGELEFDDITDAGTYPIYHFFPIKERKSFTTTLGGL
jgi:phage terminase large subunit